MKEGPFDAELVDGYTPCFQAPLLGGNCTASTPPSHYPYGIRITLWTKDPDYGVGFLLLSGLFFLPVASVSEH